MVLNFFHAGIEVLTAVDMKNSIIWDIKSCIPLKVNRRFGGTLSLHLQGRHTRQERNLREEGSKQTLTMKLEVTTTEICLVSFDLIILSILHQITAYAS
jgi:hypothetical protein